MRHRPRRQPTSRARCPARQAGWALAAKHSDDCFAPDWPSSRRSCSYSCILVAIFAPFVAPYDYTAQDYSALTQPPSRAHWLGTDDLGRDILSRLIFGARISLAVGLVVQAVILLIGVPAGLIAAHFGGKIDTVIMRTVDALYSIPSLLFVIVIMTFLRATLADREQRVYAGAGRRSTRRPAD